MAKDYGFPIKSFGSEAARRNPDAWFARLPIGLALIPISLKGFLFEGFCIVAGLSLGPGVVSNNKTLSMICFVAFIVDMAMFS